MTPADADPGIPAGFSDSEREALSRSEFAVCVATFYGDLAERLVNGAVEGFADGGVAPTSVHTHEVPGAFELPVAAHWCADSGRFAGVACLGVVIRGETDHYDYVCSETVRGCGEVALATGVPVAFGVLTCETLAQARDRSGAGPKNKGREAARAAVETASLLLALRAEGGA
jgi:6,7-dimethyl-8-ribityllumazine synthase